jgi:hypothetical protein
MNLNGRPVPGFALGDTPSSPTEQFPANVTITAQAASAALNVDPNFCRSVQQPGTPANVALQAFKLAWNSMPGKYIPAGIFYDDQAAWALGQVLGTVPVACSEGLQKSPPPKPRDPPPSHIVCDSATRRARVAAGQSTDDVMDCHLVPDATPTSTYVLWGLGVLVLVGGVWYLAR